MAEREGFEPSVEFPLHTLSKRAPSTTRPSLRTGRLVLKTGQKNTAQAALPIVRPRRQSVNQHREQRSAHTCQCICLSYTKTVAERKDPLDSCVGFDWDEANAQKNWERHAVTPEEAEDVFFHEPLVVRSDVRHSRREKRYYALGQTSRGRLLFVAFTVRRHSIRVISVRDMTRREQ